MGKIFSREVIVIEPWGLRSCIHSTSMSDYPPIYFENLNKECKKIEEKLDDVGLGIEFTTKIKDIEAYKDKRHALANYTLKLDGKIEELIDKALGKGFNTASDGMAAIDMDELQTDNTIKLKDHYSIDSNVDKEELDYTLSSLKLEDFVGNKDNEKRGDDPHGTIISKPAVEEFKKLFAEDYKSCVENDIIDGSEVTLEEYLDSLILTDTPHKKDSPFLLELIEQILQITVIVPMIEKALDKTLVTGDYLTDDEGSLRVFASSLNAVLLGSGALSGNALKLIGTELLAEITINSALICAVKNGSTAEGTLLLLFVVGALTGEISYIGMKKIDKIKYLKNLKNLDDANFKILIKKMDEKQLSAILGSCSDDLAKRIKNITKGGSKTISYTDYDKIYQSSIHNAGKDKVMLGKYEGGGSTSYITKAGKEYEYFSLGKDWNAIKAQYGYTDNDMFKLFNESFLDDGINAGKTFRFSHNPVGDKGALGMEFKYLKENNYKWDSTTLTMRPRK